MPRLFDDEIERSDPSPASRDERTFEFLNRVDGVFWARVREELEAWYADYCNFADESDAKHLRERFRQRDPEQHLPAWWELYLYRLLRHLFPDAEIVVEPDSPPGMGKVDFLVRERNATPLLAVEAVTRFSGIAGEHLPSGSEDHILGAIDEIETEEFAVIVSSLIVDPRSPQPSKAAITGPIRRWHPNVDAHDRLEFEGNGFKIELVAVERLKSGPFIAAGPAKVGYVDDISRAREALGAKKNRYPDFGCPLVLAMLPASISFTTRTAVDVLYGSEAVQFSVEDPTVNRMIRRGDGFWDRCPDVVSGVLFGVEVALHTVASRRPQLWANPRAARPLPPELQPFVVADLTADGQVEWLAPAAQMMAQLFGLDDAWPGPEPAFPHLEA